ncbi:hypothetical protein FKM82_029493 [Ascaphus truei]
MGVGHHVLVSSAAGAVCRKTQHHRRYRSRFLPAGVRRRGPRLPGTGMGVCSKLQVSLRDNVPPIPAWGINPSSCFPAVSLARTHISQLTQTTCVPTLTQSSRTGRQFFGRW